jgi:hypothetical protein
MKHRQRGIGFRRRIDAVQRQQILGAPDRVLERAISLADPRRRLQRQSALAFARSGEPVRVHLRLQRAVGGIQPRRVETIARRQPEQREIILGEVDHWAITSAVSDFRWRLGAACAVAKTASA